ncbi:hypothetical protein [Amycolatopsis sp.]|uniref:hypothetical protein n=1 Tax=Amycolatopsis sp. TaxID=37632 RepID=UPI00260CCBF1|nr:hypothetical protein [Amycolatopsis sp.]
MCIPKCGLLPSPPEAAPRYLDAVAKRADGDDWTYLEIKAPHNAMLADPHMVAEALIMLARRDEAQ